MKPSSLIPSIFHRLWWMLLTLAFHLPANGQEGKWFPLGPIDGYYSVAGGTSTALVRSLDSGGPGITSGLQVGDYIYGAFGKVFTPTGSDHYGVTQELGFAVDRAEAGDGVLPLLVLRPGTGGLTINVALPAAGALGVAYPRNSAKFAGAYDSAIAQIHSYGMGAGGLNYLLSFDGLCLLGSPNWNDTTGPKPYRLSINRIRDIVVNKINSSPHAPVEQRLPGGSPNPNYQGGMSNWELGGAVMFLSEYYAKTGDPTILPTLQRGTEMCANIIQWWNQWDNHFVSGNYFKGMVGHGGVGGDYMHAYTGGGINMVGVHTFSAMAMAKRAGVNMDARPRDGHYFGYQTPPAGVVPAGMENYDHSINEKCAMQWYWFAYKCGYWGTPWTGHDGHLGYGRDQGWTPGDSGGRTPGAVFGKTLMHLGETLSADDQHRLDRFKGYITRNYMEQQNAHAYAFGGTTFQALATTFLSDRQQRYTLDNWKFFYTLSRTSNNSIRFIEGRSRNDRGAYLDENNTKLINIALPYGIANGGYSLIPAYNVNRSLVNFKSPVLTWPSEAARTVKVTTSSQDFQLDVCDGNGNVLAPSAYTATWSHVSGPGTATFSSANTANTTVTFPSVSATPYRIRLTVSRAGVPDLVEDIDVTRANLPTPVAPSIVTQPVAQSNAPGGSVSFTVAMAGDGPFLYQWKLDGVAYWGTTPDPTLTLTNVSAGYIGSYECVITTPTGTLVSNPASFTLDATLTRLPDGLKKEVWTGITGANVNDLTSNQKFPRFTASTGVVTSAEGKINNDHCGERLSGWVKPPVTGNYRFYMSGDDGAELWLSTDASPANKVRIVNHPSISSFRSYDGVSANIPLVAGQKYYLEILHKESGGGDHVSVAWQMPGEAAPMAGSAPIPGIYLEYDFYLPKLTNCWTFDETSGNTRADSVGGVTATLYNSPTPAAGQMDGALSFNGVNQYAKATVDVSEKVYAVSLWFRTTQSGGGLFSVVDEGNGHDRHIYLKNGNIFSRVFSNEVIASTGQNYSDGQWHHMIHTFGGAIGGQKLYVDGVQVASGKKANSDLSWQTAVKIGYSADSPSPYFNGQIDDVRLYDTGLSVADAVGIYNAGVNSSPQVSAAAFSLAENSANGTAVGTVSATDSNAGQTLSYSIVGGNVGNRFAIGASTGVITVNGQLDYEGSNLFLLSVRVTDSGTPSASADAVITVGVTNVNEAPMFVANPMRGPSTAAGMAYSADLAATDQDAGDSITFMKISGPAWLSVAADGMLRGTPAAGNVGLNTFVVRVTDAGGAWSEVPLQISVVTLSSQPLWINPAGGSWPTTGNWFSGAVANGASMTADFSAADLTANATVTLDGSRTIGGLVFGDTDNQFGWTVSPGTGGTLTLDAASAPIVEVFNQSVTLGMPVAGTKGISKTGAGVLSLIGANTYTGTTAVNAGTFCVGNGTTVGTLSSSSAISIAPGAAAMWSHSSAYTIANTISGSGQWVLKGTNASNALQQSFYTPTATNSGFTGELLLDGAMTWNITNPTRLGSGSIRIRNSGTLGLNGTSISNPVTVDDGAGWHHNVGGGDVVIGAMRLEGTNTLSGNIQLNQSTGVTLGDNSGANSTLGAYSASNNTLSGVISGTGELSISRFTGWNGGTAQVVDFNLTGTSSNTYTGRTVVDGQGATTSLRLMKTGGAVAIPGGNTVQFGSNTGGQANLRMGDTTATGAARNQWNHQFGTGNDGVLLKFVNASGQWMRFELQGTQQSVAGLEAGTELTQGGAVVQNQSSALDPGQDATLTLIGSGNYLYNGLIRDQDNSATTRKLHLVKSGTGTQTLAGNSLVYFGSTTVNGGTLRIAGTLANSAVTINSGGTLDGTGTINSPVTLGAGGTLAAGDDDIGKLKFGNTVTLNSAGTVALRIDKSGTTSADNINLTGTASLELHGTLKVTFDGDVSDLAAGDRFTLFTVASGDISGDFDAFVLPTLPPTLQWSTGNLTVDGSISVDQIPPASPPVFTPEGGNYFAAQSVTISSITEGASIRYTTDGSDPLTSGTAITGTSPITGIDVPCPGTLTVKAYAFKENSLDSEVVTSSYATVPPDAVTWTNAAGGSWPASDNWINGVVANGNNLTARFDTLALSGNTSVTLDGAKTLGGATFGDAGNLYSWTIAPGSGGSLTLAGTSAPILKVNNQSAFIGVPLAGTQGFIKNGAGTLALSGASSYTGATAVNQGTLQVGIGTNVGSINAASPVTVATGAAAMWWHNSGGYTIGNAISGTGQWILQGTNATNALTQSNYGITGNNSGFSGELVINRARASGITSATQVGGALIRVQDRGQILISSGATISNTISIENSAGWYESTGGGGFVLGAIRLEGTNTLSGNLQLNQNTGVINGDGTGANSTLGSWSAATSTFSGVISGAGELSMSRYTSYNGGSFQTVNYDLTGTASNTYTGRTVVDGQGAVASLRLAKTGGAVAIPGGNVVQLGSVTGGQANLRIGDTAATGATRSQWDHQFGTANGGVLLNFVNGSGQWMRFELQGTNQSVAGLNCGTSTTLGGGIIQNQNVQAFDPGQNATLTLIGSGNYLYNGYIRDQDNGGTARKLNLVMAGSGTQTLVGSAITYSGTTTVNSGRLIFSTGAQQSLKGSSVAVASGGILEWNLATNQDLNAANTTFAGAGMIQKTGVGVLRIGYSGANRDHTIAQSPGGVLDIQAGDLNIGWSNVALNSNQGGLNLASGAKLHNSQGSGMKFDWLSGSGDLNNAHNSTTPVLTIGGANTTNNEAYNVSGNTATFSGRIGYAETYNGVSVGTLSLVKTGAGTQILSGANGYTGTTTVSGGALVINGSLANTATTVASGGTLGGTGTIAGAVTVQSGGKLAPGSGGIGTLTVNNTVTLAGTTQMEVGKSGATLTADRLSATTLNHGGTLVVTHAGPGALSAGNSFTLFGASTRSGSFASIQLPTIGANLVWDVSTLYTNGSIRVRALPVAMNDSIAVAEDGSVNIPVLANDSDADGDTLSIQSVTQGAHGSVSNGGSGVTYTPAANWYGTDTFNYTITDSREGIATATVTVTVTPVNDMPAFTANPITGADASEDSAYPGTLAGTVTDMDAGDSLAYSKVSGPAWLNVASNGALSGTPANSDIGENSFTVKVTDAAGANATATLNISVESVNDAPIWASGTITKADASEAIPYSSSLAGDASDEDAGDTLTYSKVSGPAWLSVASNGALSGTPTSSDLGANTFTVRVTDISGATADAALSINVTSANGVWTNAAGGSWPAGANWSGGTIANGLGKSADFSTLNLTADTTVTLDGGRTIGSLVFGDTTPSHNWTLNAGSGGVLKLDVATGIPTITVNNQMATLGFAISGTKGLSKAGAGTLTLSGNNIYSGGTTLNGGVLQLDGASGTALGSGDLTIASGANGFANGVYLVTDQTSGVVHFNSLGWNYARTNGRNWTVAGLDNPTGSSNNGVVENGGYNKNVSATGTITINPASGNTYTYVGVMRNADAGGGTGLLNVVKNGAGTQILKGTGIAYSGATTVNAGTLAYTPMDSDWTLPSGIKTIASGATMKVDFSPQTTQYRKTNLGAVTVNAGGVLELSGTADNVNGFYLINGGSIGGAGTIRVVGGGSSNVWTNTNALSGFTGLLDIQNGRFACNIPGGSTLGGNLDVNIAASGKLDLRSGHFTIDALDGAAGSLVHKSWTGDTVNFTIGSGNGSGTFAGVMQNTNYNVIKTGTGTQTLSGVNTYTGTTTVNGGTLRVNGSLANGAVTVANGGTLAGTGTVGGATTVQSGGAIAPGAGGIGTLTINNTLSLSGTTLMEISKSGGTFTADKVSGVSTLTYGGTLTVTNVGPDALVAGNTFQLFSATTYSGSFTTFNLPTLGSGLAWDTSRLTADGTIAVYSTSGSGLPAGWAKADIGSPSIAGTSSESGGVFTLAGSGTGFANGSDQAHFIWQTLSGDGEVKVQLTGMSGGDATNATAGVMIRESTLAGSRFAFCGRKGDGSMQLIRRLSSGGNITTTTNGTNSTPVWVRLVRAGNTITAYKSTDGSSWTTVSTDTVSMASQISIGVLTSSGNNTSSTTATFDNVIIVP